MKLQKMMTNENFSVTAKIQNEYPALYEHLSETPLFSANMENVISLGDYQEYLESIQVQLNACKESEPGV